MFDAHTGPLSKAKGILLAGKQRLVPAPDVGRIVAHPPYGTEIIVVIACDNDAALQELAHRIARSSAQRDPDAFITSDQTAAQSGGLSVIKHVQAESKDTVVRPQWSWSKISITTQPLPE